MNSGHRFLGPVVTGLRPRPLAELKVMHHKLSHAACTIGLWLLVLCLVPSSVAAGQAQESSFTIREQLIIGDDEDASAEYLFYFPEFVRTDSRDYIYVNDARRADVRVFDTNGQYLTTIGKRGKGPGEMQEIVGMHVDGSDRLIVVDRNSKRLTIFTNMGRNFSMENTVDKGLVMPNPILSLDDNYLLSYVRWLPNPESGPSLMDERFLHVHDAGLNRIETFGLLADLFDLSSPFLKAHSDSPRAIMVATDGMGTVVAAPYVYNGYVLRYVRSNDRWVMNKLKGKTLAERAFVTVSKEEIDSSEDVKRGAIVTSSPAGPQRVRVFSRSRGIGILSTGQILHFVARTPLHKHFEPLVELYGQDGSLQAYGKLLFDDSELNENADIMKFVALQWIDAADRLYIARRNPDGFFVLSVAELEITPL